MAKQYNESDRARLNSRMAGDRIRLNLFMTGQGLFLALIAFAYAGAVGAGLYGVGTLVIASMIGGNVAIHSSRWIWRIGGYAINLTIHAGLTACLIWYALFTGPSLGGWGVWKYAVAPYLVLAFFNPCIRVFGNDRLITRLRAEQGALDPDADPELEARPGWDSARPGLDPAPSQGLFGDSADLATQRATAAARPRPVSARDRAARLAHRGPPPAEPIVTRAALPGVQRKPKAKPSAMAGTGAAVIQPTGGGTDRVASPAGAPPFDELEPVPAADDAAGRKTQERGRGRYTEPPPMDEAYHRRVRAAQLVIERGPALIWVHLFLTLLALLITGLVYFALPETVGGARAWVLLVAVPGLAANLLLRHCQLRIRSVAYGINAAQSVAYGLITGYWVIDYMGRVFAGRLIWLSLVPFTLAPVGFLLWKNPLLWIYQSDVELTGHQAFLAAQAPATSRASTD